METDNNQNDNNKPVRRRGRPKKIVDNNVINNEPNKEPKKRGRKPKPKPKPDPNAPDNQEVKKRGRKPNPDNIKKKGRKPKEKVYGFNVNNQITQFITQNQNIILHLPIKYSNYKHKINHSLEQQLLNYQPDILTPTPHNDNGNFALINKENSDLNLYCKHTGKGSLYKCEKCADKFNLKQNVNLDTLKQNRIDDDNLHLINNPIQDVNFNKIVDHPIDPKSIKNQSYNPDDIIISPELDKLADLLCFNENYSSNINQLPIDQIDDFDLRKKENINYDIDNLLNLNLNGKKLPDEQYHQIINVLSNEIKTLKDKLDIQNSTDPSIQIDTFNITNLYSQLLECIEVNSWPSKTDRWCDWDGHPFDSTPIPLPLKYLDHKQKFKISGKIFCHFSCMIKFAEFFGYDLSIINFFYRKVTGHQYFHNFCRSLPREALKVFGGEYDIKTFRYKSHDPNLKCEILSAPLFVNEEQLKEYYETRFNPNSKNDNTLKIKRNKPLPGSKSTLPYIIKNLNKI